MTDDKAKEIAGYLRALNEMRDAQPLPTPMTEEEFDKLNQHINSTLKRLAEGLFMGQTAAERAQKLSQ